MIDFASRPLLRLLRVPPQPRLPAGAPGSARVFRAAPNYWSLRLLGWGVQQMLTLVGFVVFMMMMQVATAGVEAGRYAGPPLLRRVAPRARTVSPPPFVTTLPLVVIEAIEAVAVGIWLIQLPITFALLRLDYELRWYIVTDRAARLREGILNLREMTFTLANVQDIRIQQGPVQRLFGLADVELRTAGGREATAGDSRHAATEARNLHLARFRGVANAAAIRDLVVDRMKKARGAGLGDPEDVAAAPAPPFTALAGRDALLDAARALGEESARLRRAVCS